MPTTTVNYHKVVLHIWREGETLQMEHIYIYKKKRQDGLQQMLRLRNTFDF